MDMAADEIIVERPVRPVRTAAYAKLYQRASHFAIVGVAAALEVSGGTIVSARIGLTGAASHARRLINVEQALAGQPLSNEVIGRAAQSGRAGSSGRQLGHPRERGLPPRDDPGVHAAGADGSNGTRVITPVM